MLGCFPDNKPPLCISPYDAVERASLENDTRVLLRAEDAGGWKPVCNSRVRTGMNCSASLLPTSKDGQWYQRGTTSSSWILAACEHKPVRFCLNFQAHNQPCCWSQPRQACFLEPEFSMLPLAYAHWMGQRPLDAEWGFLLHKDVMHSAWSAHQQGDNSLAKGQLISKGTTSAGPWITPRLMLPFPH